MEKVGVIDGVTFINDSKATNADAARQAMATYPRFFWIAGGVPKAGGIDSLADLFPPGQGAFGCEAEDRAELIGIARHKAGDWPADRTVAVGDTQTDMAGARAAGIKVVGFGTGLDEADAVIERIDELPAALALLDD